MNEELFFSSTRSNIESLSSSTPLISVIPIKKLKGLFCGLFCYSHRLCHMFYSLYSEF